MQRASAFFAGNSGSPTKVAPISIFGGQVNNGAPTKVSPIISKIPVSPVTGIFAGNGSPTKVSPIIGRIPVNPVLSIFAGQGGTGGTSTNPAPPKTSPPPKGGKGNGHGSYGYGFYRGYAFGGPSGVSTTTAVTSVSAGSTAVSPQTATASGDNTPVAADPTFTVNGSDFGAQEGRVGVMVGQDVVPAQVVNWSDNAITITVPPAGLNAAGKATLVIQRADGSTPRTMNVELAAK